jgi:hypothetical protein
MITRYAELDFDISIISLLAMASRGWREGMA